MSRNFLIVDPEEGIETLKALASPVRVGILKLLHQQGPMNVNAVAAAMEAFGAWAPPVAAGVLQLAAAAVLTMGETMQIPVMTKRRMGTPVSIELWFVSKGEGGKGQGGWVNAKIAAFFMARATTRMAPMPKASGRAPLADGSDL